VGYIRPTKAKRQNHPIPIGPGRNLVKNCASFNLAKFACASFEFGCVAGSPVTEAPATRLLGLFKNEENA